MSKTYKQDQLSYLYGCSDEPLLYATIGDMLVHRTHTTPDLEALVDVHRDVRWSWSELLSRVDHLASTLLQQNCGIGERVAIWSPNCAEWVLVQLATARIGAILVTINPAYRASELEHALQLTDCRWLILARRHKSSDYVDLLRTVVPDIDKPNRIENWDRPSGPEHIYLIDPEPDDKLLPFNTLLEGEIDRDTLASRAADLQPEDPINIQFTSGTSGNPKGATLTHHNILNNGAEVGRMMGIVEGDRICIPVPLYHCFGMVMGVLNCIAHGATMVFPAPAFEPRSVLEAVSRERCTALFGVPAMFVAELADPNLAQYDLSSLRTGIMAGAPCPSDLMRQVIEVMGMRDVTICYGMTETSPVSFQTRADSPIDVRINTVGTIHPHLEAKLIDDDGRAIPLGEIGEICVRGYSVMDGYWSQPEKTKQTIDRHGWLHTGDLGRFNTDGLCKIVGRSKDMIIRGGENIYPAEVENFLHSHPHIVEAAVFGLPDERMGEIACAWLRTDHPMTAEEIVQYCQDKISHYKIPQKICFVESFPMTVTGKIQKFVMQETMLQKDGDSQKT